MRTLVILRGAPASGKSTWVRNEGLEEYTLSADKIRLLFQSPVMDDKSVHLKISQRNDKRVWNLLFELLEERMARGGEFAVIDATHCRPTDFSRYNRLCRKYRYRRYWVDFSDVPVEVCKKRNAERKPYKRVPENVIEKMYARMQTQGNTSGWVKVDRNNFHETVSIEPLDFNGYEEVVVFGDIHGCYQPLKEYFDIKPFSDNTGYIFTGDYLDRGVQNRETLEFLFSLMDKENVLFLEGNHERWLYHYSHNETEKIKSREFKNNTIPQIRETDKKDIRRFCHRLGQMAHFTFSGRTYFISHGGIGYMPDDLLSVATEQFVKGVGSYETDIDKIWSENEKEIIQIHGHRNLFDVKSVGTSVNLENSVEFGGKLRIYTIGKTSDDFLEIQNSIYRKKKIPQTDSPANVPVVEQLRDSEWIQEKELGNNISSFNFTRKAFYKRRWNDLTCKARGLYVDTETDRVVARGYDKFFNINENSQTDITRLIREFGENRIACYKKENGFLGIMSWVNGELFMASKSSNQEKHAEYFRQIFRQSNIKKEVLADFLANNNVTLLFEVIDIENDPHIIRYNESGLILLDIVENDYRFSRRTYESVKKLADAIDCRCKTVVCEFDNSQDFYKWYIAKTDGNNMTDADMEGVVVECNGVMTKLKFPYYKFWKAMRGIKDKVGHGTNISLESLYNTESNYFYAWLTTLDREFVKETDIITLRDMFHENREQSGGKGAKNDRTVQW